MNIVDVMIPPSLIFSMHPSRCVSTSLHMILFVSLVAQTDGALKCSCIYYIIGLRVDAIIPAELNSV